MMRLAEYRSKVSLLADFLPWAALIGEGVVLNKDGSFQRTARFRGPDLDSATPSTMQSCSCPSCFVGQKRDAGSFKSLNSCMS